jgi:hypothetical protein
MMRLSAILLFAALPLLGALAADMPIPLRGTSPASAPASAVSLQGYGDSDKTCAEWTDACRTCRRAESGEPVCSNIGPTCQPAAITCTRKVEPTKQ